MSATGRERRLQRCVADVAGLEDPLVRLDAARQAREAFDQLETDAVVRCRDAGTTWKDVGEVCGLTKQGAQQRFGPRSTS